MKKIELLILLTLGLTIEVHSTNVFSVSATKEVCIAKGNLQYTQSTGIWSFAEYPYTTLGLGNVSGMVLSDKIDLFGWSGNNTTIAWGVSNSINNYEYGGDFVDWGQNTIGTDEPNTWRTLTRAEWTYLLTSRDSSLSGVARIKLNGGGFVNGLVLLPDAWSCPAGFVFKSGSASESGMQAYADYQTFSVAQWDTLEASGAVFLPAAGYRRAFSLDEIGITAQYWTATKSENSSQAQSYGFTANNLLCGGNTDRCTGLPVRLVKDAVYYTISIAPSKYGSVSISQSKGIEGDVATITTKSDSLCSLHALQVWQDTTNIPITPAEGQYGQYTFVMPKGNVVVKAVFYGPASAFTPKEFSISTTQKVYFSQGNLRCSGVRNGHYLWEFAYYQTDILGTANINGQALADTIDLFGWSGDSGTAKWGVSASTVAANYSGDFVDWGQNTIGTDTLNTWRTLTQTEWNYLINERTEAEDHLGIARIEVDKNDSLYVDGFVLLPDDWICPDEVAFVTGLGTGNLEKGYADQQIISHEDWLKLEETGAVFLPASGDRHGTAINNVQWSGTYQSATTSSDAGLAYYMYFTPTVVETTIAFLRSYGLAVRLVRDTNKTPTDLISTKDMNKNVMKYIVNGQLVIEKNGKKYNVMGNVLK